MGFEIINQIKRERGLTNAQISEMSGVTLSTLDKITSGANKNPKLDTLQAICRVLGCSLNDFADQPLAETKKSPALADTSTREITLEESNELLVALGYIQPGGQLSDEDLSFLAHVIGLLDAWFDKHP